MRRGPSTQAFTLTVNAAAAITSATSTTFTVGTTPSFTVTTTGFPAPKLTETGALPSGITFKDNGNGTATVTGTLTAASEGSFPLTITAANTTATVTQPLTISVVSGTLQIISAPSATFTAGVAGTTFTITATGTTTPTLSESGALPAGLIFTAGTNGTATLSGTPAATDKGTYSLNITATNGSGSTRQAFTLTVNQKPAFTSPTTATETAATAFSLSVAATAFPTASFSETGTLPAGVTFTDNGSGTATIAGTAAVGTYPLTITAANAAGSTLQSFVLTVKAAVVTGANVPVFTSPASDTITVGATFDFTVTTVASTQALTITTKLKSSGTLPPGVSFGNNGDGTADITGPANSGGIFPITITATNSAGSTSQSFVLTVNAAPKVTSAASATASVGAAFGFTVKTSGSPVPAITEAGGLPAGLTFSDNGNGTALLSGTPNAGTGGVYTLTISAMNLLGTSTQTFTLTVRQPPVITSASHASATHGTAFTFTFSATGSPLPSITHSGTVKGLTYTPNSNGTVTLAGTPTTAGTYTLTITAKNNNGTATQTFTLTVS